MNINDLPNALQYFTRNRHSDYPEVVFSSILTNLLDPDVHLVFQDELLLWVFEYCFGNGSYRNSHKVEVKSEVPLGTSGSIDCLIKVDDSILGIEVKIWDRSAINIDANGVSQLVRYANKLREMTKNWRLIFLIPTVDSSTCIKEFQKAYEEFPHNILLLSWNPFDINNITSINGIMSDSLLEAIMNLTPRKDTISQWLYKSLIEEIPKLVVAIPEKGQFPTKDDLLNRPGLGNIYNAIFEEYKRVPTTLHTTVGIPYESGDKKSKFHNNSLFRVRTVKEYYKTEVEKSKFLPEEYVEIEIWMDVYLAVEEDLVEFSNKYKLPLGEGYHLDKSKNIQVKVLKISPSSYSMHDNEILKNLDKIMRNGFNKAQRQKSL